MGPAPVEALDARLRALVEQVHGADAMLGEGHEDGVHDLRVALRRTRSLLRSFRPALREDAQGTADLLVGECRWAGGVLGPIRDAEVVHQRVAALIDGQPAELLLGGVAARVADVDRESRRRGRREVESLRCDPRHQRLLQDLADFASGRPFDEVDEAVVRDRLRKDWRRARRRAAAAAQLPEGSEARTAALHATRKAAKRARYAAEAAGPVLGDVAARVEAVAEQVQEELGTHRDTVLTRTLLRELGVRAHLDGDNGFTFGRLHALEEARGAAALRDYERAARELQRRRHRRALRRGT